MNDSEQKKSSDIQGASGAEPGGKREPIVEQAKHALTNVAGQAREQVNDRIDARKDRAVETMTGVAGAIRETSEKLDGMGPLGDVAGRAAEGIERLARFFEGRQVTDLVRDVERFARREPAIFLGAAFVAGLIGGRFLKSSTRRPESASVGGGRGVGDDSWMDGVEYGDGFLSSDDLEEYESRRFVDRGFDSRHEGELRDTLPMGSRSGERASSVDRSRSSSTSGQGGRTSYTRGPRVETEGPVIAPTPIVSAASANENKTAPMPATQGSPGASASTSSGASNVPSAPSAPGNGHTGRV